MTDRKPLAPMSEIERTARLARAGLGPDLIPLNLTPEERLAAQNPGLPMEPRMDPTAPASPTGTPVVNATGLLLKIAAVVVAIAAVVAVSDFFPATTLDETIAGAIVGLGAVLGIASPGVRKQN